MLADNIKLFSKICQLTTICRSGLVNWNSKDNKVEGKKIPKNEACKGTPRKYHLLTFATFIVCTQTYFSVSKTFSNATSKDGRQNIMITQFQNGLAAIVLIALTTYLHTSRQQSTEVILCINGLLQFARKYNNGSLQKDYSKMELLNVLFAQAMYVTSIILPVGFIYGLHWSDPCKPSLAGYWLIRECWEYKPNQTYLLDWNGLLKIGTKMIVLLFNHWMWQFGYSITMFVIAGIQILCTMSLQSYLRIFWNIANHKQHHSYEVGLIYRNIQVLARLINTIQQGAHMTVLIVGAVMIQAVSSTILVRLPWSLVNLPYIAVFSIIWIDATLACIVCIGGMAGVYTEAVKVHQKIRGKSRSLLMNNSSKRGMDFKWQQRFWKSCMLIKIRFGGFNYIDGETPLNCINMANALSVQLLLLGL